MDHRIFAQHLKIPKGIVGIEVAKIMNHINRFMIEFTFDKMNIQNDEKILEIGFGNGTHINSIFQKLNNKFRYHGLEYSETMFDEALRANEVAIIEKRVDLKLGYSNDMEYSNDFFDKVCLINTIYFWKTPETDLKEIYRVLKKNGAVYIAIRSNETLKKEMFTKYYFKFFEYEELTELLHLVGFLNVEKEHIIEPDKENELDILLITAYK